MRKNFDSILFALARFGLVISIFGALLASIASIIMVSFDIKGKVPLGKNRWISLSAFDRGIPFPARLATEIPDSSIASGDASTHSLHYYYPESFDTPPAPVLDSTKYSDKIKADITVFNRWGNSTAMKVNGARLESATFYLQPTNFPDRLLLSLPGIMTWLLFAFCSWQILKIIRAIHSGSTFNESVSKRIASIGWAIIAVTFSFLILDYLQSNVSGVNVRFSSTIPNYRFPFYLSAHKESFTQLHWVFLGAVILIVGKAFRYGNQLQNYEDSTI